ncbi:hypothetical protein [Bacteroides sp.]|uniref:hypothetical protein n=1 Tax=Bacteroides sp. TaxID=29523 RepID=UPI0023C8D2A3|nr:hypothetical protein [Bacteroides sp.]MDE6215548.1 hypothetical protein [Bacteroides sp.]
MSRSLSTAARWTGTHGIPSSCNSRRKASAGRRRANASLPGACTGMGPRQKSPARDRCLRQRVKSLSERHGRPADNEGTSSTNKRQAAASAGGRQS